jgi:hypothetical protein
MLRIMQHLFSKDQAKVLRIILLKGKQTCSCKMAVFDFEEKFVNNFKASCTNRYDRTIDKKL